MERLKRIRSVLGNIIQRLRLMSSSQTVVLEVEVASSYDCPSEASAVASQTNRQKLYVRLSSSFIEIDGLRTPGNKSLLTDQILGQVLADNHHNLPDIRLLIVTHHTLLSSIPVTVGKLVNLTVLDLSFNQLHDLPWSIVCLRKLKILKLNDNQFYTVPPIVARLTSLELLCLNDNCLEYLPTSLLQLDKLQVLEVCRNKRLIAPPQSVCENGLDAIFTHLRKRVSRRNVWSDSTHFYRSQSVEGDSASHSGVKSLLEISVATVLQFDLDFFTLPFVPPPLKRHLYDSSREKMATVRVAKCSQCRAFFSTQAYFDGHDCRR